MDLRDLQNLKTLFQAIKDVNYKPDFNIPYSIRANSLASLRKLPQFQAEQFKDDNTLINTLIQYLKDPRKKEDFLAKAGFTQKQQEEFRVILEKKSTGEEVSEQPTQEAQTSEQAEQPPVGEPSSTMADQGIPNLPSTPSIHAAPKIVIHDIPHTPEETPGSKLFIANKNMNIIGEKVVKEVGNKTGIGLKKGLTRAGTNLSGMLGGIGRGGGGLLGGIAGGGGKFLGGTLLRGGYALADIGTQMTRGRGIAISGRLLVFIFLGLFLSAGILTGFAPSQTPGTQPAPAQVGQGQALDYKIPFRNSSISVSNPDVIKNQVKSFWPNAKLANWDTIVQQSINNGWNPAFVLTLWIEETGAQGVPNYSDPLGCAPGQPTADIDLSLKCLFNNFSRFGNDKFANFMCMYSESKLSPCSFLANKFFPKNIKDWYSKLVPSGPGALAPIATSPPVAGGAVVSCPLDGTRVISCGSFMSDNRFNVNKCRGTQPIERGHCGSNYGWCSNPHTKDRIVLITDPNEIPKLRRAHSIDINASPGEQVKLPFINGKSSAWFHNSGLDFGPLSPEEGGGYIRVFNTDVDGNVWLVYFIHVDPIVISPPLGRGYHSGDPVLTIANTGFPHLHVNIGSDEGGRKLVNYGENNGWLDPESLGLCVSE
ncbi:MAG: hypothetical protein AAB414_00695 [Patescibacteria group bacterium]